MKKIAFALVALFMVNTAEAHKVYMESEFPYPYRPITNPGEAKIIVSYLEEGEVDMYSVAISPCMFVANALPPACEQYREFHPSVALIGPGLPAATETLPFEIPDGFGVVVAHNPKQNPDMRPIYTETPDAFNEDIAEAEANGCEVDGEMTGNLSWFLPYGLTQNCLHCAPWACNFDNSLALPFFPPQYSPGLYRLAVWDPTGRPGDYVLNIGTGEGESSCEDIRHTVSIIQGMLDGSVYRKANCVSAGESGWDCCDINYNGVCDTEESISPWP